jgi:hypothetical protein
MKRTKQDIKKKKNNHGCGKAKCYLCHSEKILDIPSRRQIKARIDFDEQSNEIEFSRHPIDKEDPEVWLLQLGAIRTTWFYNNDYCVQYIINHGLFNYTIKTKPSGDLIRQWYIFGREIYRGPSKDVVKNVLSLFTT